ncbi:unnamed protein product [Sphenostylis stenocarpa]|uniref:Uncharacterized protein n=1 Tax=Sphenostylis stenocarpa TaxID=92480 RepID=A0AA86SSJ8_9FABA|nr:unnamed protein product [Sphenostylis stenocarpa]
MDAFRVALSEGASCSVTLPIFPTDFSQVHLFQKTICTTSQRNAWSSSSLQQYNLIERLGNPCFYVFRTSFIPRISALCILLGCHIYVLIQKLQKQRVSHQIV